MRSSELRPRSASRLVLSAVETERLVIREIRSDKATSERGSFAVASEHFLGGFCDFFSAGLLGGRSRKILVGPDDPAAHALVFGESLICGFDDAGQDRFGLSIRRTAQGSAFPPTANGMTTLSFTRGLGFQCVLQVFGIDVHSGGSDDDVFLTAFEK